MEPELGTQGSSRPTETELDKKEMMHLSPTLRIGSTTFLAGVGLVRILFALRVCTRLGPLKACPQEVTSAS